MQRRDHDEIMKAVQERRLKGNLQVQNQVQAQPQPQKCPRCDSLNTKFCYYNNYSLSQPRYLCKTCRRYWTQGGTLRNVPVGGGCRKGKRPKPSSQHSDNTRSTQPPQPPPPRQPVVQQISLSTTPQPIILSGTPVMTTSSSYFNPGEEVGSSSRWVNSFGSSQIGQSQIQASEIIYEMMDHHQSGKIAVNSSSPATWPETYINNNSSNPLAAVGDTIVWTSGNSNTAVDQSSLDPNQWPDYMRGFCPPP